MNQEITILIVDDNHFMRETLSFLISRVENFHLVGQASSGVEAIQLAQDLAPDIILLDINMTPVNGFEATRKILKKNPLIKIIGLSVHKQPSYAKNILQLGARGYITKSSPHKEIIFAINRVFEGSEYVCEELTDLL
ncbi:MAG: response regulator transcription factor [Chitinophagaceae bacterium]